MAVEDACLLGFQAVGFVGFQIFQDVSLKPTTHSPFGLEGATPNPKPEPRRALFARAPPSARKWVLQKHQPTEHLVRAVALAFKLLNLKTPEFNNYPSESSY